MEQDPPQDPPSQPAPPPKPVIPPPNLSPPPPPPVLSSSPLPSGPGNAAAKVNLRGPGDGPLEVPATGGAPFNSRLAAAVIDALVGTGVMIGLFMILPGFADRLAYLASLAYMVTRDSLPFLGGQSVGKKAMKIRAVTLDGGSLVGKWETALIRNGVLAIPLFGLVELFVLLSREDKPERGRRLGDEWAKTKVIIDEKPPVAGIDEPPEPPAAV
jgi:uncharacterized RDD family membrane protein YckC